MDDRHLYRGKLIDNDEWAKGAYVKFDDTRPQTAYKGESEILHVILTEDDFSFLPEKCEVIPGTIGQCTGRKLGKQSLFEGDIVENGGGRWTVIWCDTTCAFLIQSWGNDCMQEGEALGIDELMDNAEIVGNIHDNLELVGVSNA